MKSLSTGLLLLGVIWALVVVWMFLALMGITDPISVTRVVLYFVVLLLGPLLLIAGPILVLSGRHPKAGAILAMVGCIILRIVVEDPGEIADRIEAGMKELAIQVSGHETAIAEVAKSVHVGISIAVLSDELPILDLSSESVRVIAALGAGVHFDLIIASED